MWIAAVFFAAGACIAVPMLEAMNHSAAAAAPDAAPTRMLCVGLHLGFHGPAFFPKQAGANYQLPPLLRPLEPFRGDFTVFSGLDHPNVGKGHPATVNFLTGVEKPKKRKQMSVDQAAARVVGAQTRFPSLQLEAKRNQQKGRPMSWAPGGIPLPLSNDPRAVFDKLFRATTDPEKLKQTLDNSRSVLDHVLEDARSLQARLGAADRVKLDEYLAAIREVEAQIQQAERFAAEPVKQVTADLQIPDKPRLNAKEASRLMLHLSALAFQADLTRVITYRIPGENHAVSHHGQKKKKVQAFVDLQRGYMTELAKLLQQLKATPDGDGTLLDHTLVLLGSGMGNASNHSTRNLPVLLAGGGLRHGRHLSFGGARKRPLCNLYVTMLQRMGLPVQKFSTSRGSMNDLLT